MELWILLNSTSVSCSRTLVHDGIDSSWIIYGYARPGSANFWCHAIPICDFLLHNLFAGCGRGRTEGVTISFPKILPLVHDPCGVGNGGLSRGEQSTFLILSAMLVPSSFVFWKLARRIYAHHTTEKARSDRKSIMKSVNFAELQFELYGEKALSHLHHLSAYDLMKLSKRLSNSGHTFSFDDSDCDEKVAKENDDEVTEVEDELDNFMLFLHDPSKKDVVGVDV